VHPGGDHMTPLGEPDLDAWALEVTDPVPDRDLGELADWATSVTDRRDEDQPA
jgi:hypothetical protein